MPVHDEPSILITECLEMLDLDTTYMLGMLLMTSRTSASGLILTEPCALF